MEAAHVLAFNAALLAAWLAPGPAFLVALRASVVNGRTAGIATGLGLAIVASLWTLAALIGLDGVFAVAPWSFALMKTAGAVYLIWIAVQTWRGARDPLPETPVSHGRAVVDGMLVNLANPKSVLFAGAVLVVIFPPDLSLGAQLFIAGNHLLLEVTLYGLLALGLSQPQVRGRYLQLKPAFDRVSALVLGALGLRLLLERAR